MTGELALTARQCECLYGVAVEPLHLYFLQGVLVASVVVLFLLWLRGLSEEDLRVESTPVQA